MTISEQPRVPDEFRIMSFAYSRLMQGVWGGVRRPVRLGRSSIETRERRDYASSRLTAAALKGTITIYAVGETPIRPVEGLFDKFPRPQIEPIVVPPTILKQLIQRRGQIPDHVIGGAVRKIVSDSVLVEALTYGALALRQADFSSWYRAERNRGKWPSQRARRKKQIGRPTRQTPELRSHILKLVDAGKWSHQDGIPALRLLLLESFADVPSVDTIERLIKNLYIETRHAAFQKPQRVPPKV